METHITSSISMLFLLVRPFTILFCQRDMIPWNKKGMGSVVNLLPLHWGGGRGGGGGGVCHTRSYLIAQIHAVCQFGTSVTGCYREVTLWYSDQVFTDCYNLA